MPMGIGGQGICVDLRGSLGIGPMEVAPHGAPTHAIACPHLQLAREGHVGKLGARVLWEPPARMAVYIAGVSIKAQRPAEVRTARYRDYTAPGAHRWQQQPGVAGVDRKKE
eukprot:365817-Chlamydomonas_euryale.AAC.15